MNPYDLNTGRQMQPTGLAGATAAPMNADAVDLPPGVGGTYYGGPLANPSPATPSPTPTTNSLSVLAAGGTNHQEAWMQGQTSPQTLPQQAPFSSEADLPPGAPPYAGGPLATMPQPSPTPKPKSIDPAAISHFAWGSAFETPKSY